MATAELNTAAGVRRDPFPRPWTATEFERARGMGAFGDRAAEWIDGQIVERIDGELRPFVFTRKEYQALEDAQFFRGQRIQLLAGELIQDPFMNPPHVMSLRLTTKVLERIFGDGYDVRVQVPLDLGLTTEPHPDLAVVVGSPRDYAEHPTTAILVVEISDTTFDFDTHEKASLYAAAGIADYWVVDLAGRRILVMRNPEPREGEAHGHWYRSVSGFDADGTVTPLAVPTARVRVADLLP